MLWWKASTMPAILSDFFLFLCLIAFLTGVVVAGSSLL
jgi:hypothetical protein